MKWAPRFLVIAAAGLPVTDSLTPPRCRSPSLLEAGGFRETSSVLVPRSGTAGVVARGGASTEVAGVGFPGFLSP